jgi:hypothetical protein
VGRATDYRAFKLPDGWQAERTPTGKEESIGDATLKSVGEHSLAPLNGLPILLFHKNEILCSYPQVGPDGSTLIPCGKSVSCSYFKVIVNGIICSALHNSLGIHVKVGNSGEGECPHFICKDYISH